jgi:hypothetical protein
MHYKTGLEAARANHLHEHFTLIDINRLAVYHKVAYRHLPSSYKADPEALVFWTDPYRRYKGVFAMMYNETMYFWNPRLKKWLLI